MKYPKRKTKVKAISISNEVCEKLESQAKHQNRSISNFIETILMEYFKNINQK